MPNPDAASPMRCSLLATTSKDDLPREKLFREGRRALSDEELLAIFLRTGIPGCNVLQLAAKLKRQAGSLADLGQMEASDIASMFKGIGAAKAATLAAAFELGQRAVRAQLQRAEMGTARQVYDYLVGELRFEMQEVLCILLLDNRKRLIRTERIAVGTLTRVITHPRNVFAPALRFNAAKVIIAHNHPSGGVEPSAHDVQFTKSLAEAGEVLGIPLVDHVIIGAADAQTPVPYYSFAENGKL